MKKFLFIGLLAFICQLWIPTTTKAQDLSNKKIVEIKSQEVPKTRSLNPNIKIKAPKNDNNPLPASVKKGNKTPGLKDCEIVFDNYTGYFIEVYLDGEYKGTIGEWGSLYVTVTSGYAKVYCIITGGTKEWNVEGNCEGNYIWKLQ